MKERVFSFSLFILLATFFELCYMSSYTFAQESTADTTLSNQSNLRQVKIVEVNNWKTFVTAYNDPSVTQIKVTADLTNDNSARIANRETSIDIDGGNHIFNMGSASLSIKAFDTGPQTISVHDISQVSSSQSTVQGFISNNRDWAMGNSGWTINVANVSSDKSMRTRLVTSLGSQLNLSGTINWYTASEMAQISGVRIENNAVVTAFKANTPDNRSFFWFADTTGLGVGSREFVIGQNAVASFKMATGGTAYPVVFAYYDRIHLEKGATYNATMPGNAFRADYRPSDFIADGENKINFTSLSRGNSPIYFSGADRNKQNVFQVGPNSELYVISATNSPLFTAARSDTSNRRVIIDSPKLLDLKNYSTSSRAANSAITDGKLGSFKITNSDINLWHLPSSVNSNPDFKCNKIAYVEQTPNGVTSDNNALQKVFDTTNKRRISALNQKPTTEWAPLTDADKTISTRVKIGEFPDNNGMDDNGHINYLPVYAAKGEAIVDITDTVGLSHPSISTDEQGYASYKALDYQKAGKQMISLAQRGPWDQDSPVGTTIIDITPPEPAKITSGSLSPISKQIIGAGEVGSTVTLTLNDQEASAITSIVDNSGEFTLDISSLKLKDGDKVQIFLRDHSGKANLPDCPVTNNEVGNIQPKADMTYRDRVFKAATTLTVQGGLTFEVPNSLDFGTTKLSSESLVLKGVGTNALIVSDTRATGKKNNWKLSLKEKVALISTHMSLTYINRDGQTLTINDQNQTIEHNLSNSPEEDRISDAWQSNTKGIFLTIPPEFQKIGNYTGQLSWTLEATPQAD